MAHEIDIMGTVGLPPAITLNAMISGYLDAGDFHAASLAILAHPASVEFSQPTLRRLWTIANSPSEPAHIDCKMIEVLATYCETAEGLVWNH